jgi:hypothetical protein
MDGELVGEKKDVKLVEDDEEGKEYVFLTNI